MKKQNFHSIGSLPHRQLRNLQMRKSQAAVSSLPHRQLRKIRNYVQDELKGSLPHRQLRKVKIIAVGWVTLFTAAQAA